MEPYPEAYRLHVSPSKRGRELKYALPPAGRCPRWPVAPTQGRELKFALAHEAQHSLESPPTRGRELK